MGPGGRLPGLPVLIALDNYGTPYNIAMYTVIETPVFRRLVDEIWSADERQEFVVWLANNALAGDVIPGPGGLRKIRWSRTGMGKRGGVRVIYYNLLDEGTITLLMVYTKAKFDNLPPAFLRQLRDELDNG